MTEATHSPNTSSPKSISRDDIKFFETPVIEPQTQITSKTALAQADDDFSKLFNKPVSPQSSTGKSGPAAGNSLLVDLPVTNPQINTAGDARAEKTVNLLDDTPLEQPKKTAAAQGASIQF
jgi:hypothetical protein